MEGIVFVIALIPISVILWKYLSYRSKTETVKDYVRRLNNGAPSYRSLSDFIQFIQHPLEDDFKITPPEEQETLPIILRNFADFINQQYLNNKLELPKLKIEVSDDDFFIYYLCIYLQAYIDEDDIAGHKITGELLSSFDVESMGTKTYYRRHALTEFGIVYFKLLYICFEYYNRELAVNVSYRYLENRDSIRKWILSKATDEHIHSYS